MADKKDDWTKFPAVPAPTKSVRGKEPLLVGILGPPGSGKTRSMLRMMRGVQRVFPGPLVLVDTEAGRSKKYSPRKGEVARPDDPVEPTYDFERIDLDPPFRGDRVWAAIKSGLAINPAAVGTDNLSDEHSGEGGYLDWHDKEIERMGGNEWGAWGRPAAARKRLLSGISHVPAPPILFFTFVAEEKTEQIEVDDPQSGRKKKKIVNKGWTPVAPLLILKTLDLTCILPWDSKGKPIWESRKLPHEDFIRKWPDQLRAIFKPGQITEEHGEALARWAKGEPAGPVQVGGDLKVPSCPPSATTPSTAGTQGRDAVLEEILELAKRLKTREEKMDAWRRHFLAEDWLAVKKLDVPALMAGRDAFRRELDGLASMRAEQPEDRLPGED